MERDFIRIYDGTGHYYDARCNADSSLKEDVIAYVIADCFDAQDIYYFRNKPKTLKKGTEISISAIVHNFYGLYFRAYVDNQRYDIAPSNVSFVKPAERN